MLNSPRYADGDIEVWPDGNASLPDVLVVRPPIGIRNWADPTGAGYQTASHWGVLRLLSDSSEIEIPGGDAEKPGDEKPQPSDDADNDKMPQTGSAVIGVAVVALLLVAAGCGLVIARRR